PLQLRINKLDALQATFLGAFLSRSSLVTYLNVRGASLGQSPSMLGRLMKELGSCSSLQHLDLSENGLGSEGMQAVCEAVAESDSIQELVLSDNHVGRMGAACLGDLCRQNQSVRKMDLSNNSVGTEGAIYIAAGLLENHALMSLNLELNSIGADAKQMLTAAVLIEELGFNRVIDTKLNRQGCPNQFSTVAATEAKEAKEAKEAAKEEEALLGAERSGAKRKTLLGKLQPLD
ncbi:unnamed protein product, partial [Polarella glacialis]